MGATESHPSNPSHRLCVLPQTPSSSPSARRDDDEDHPSRLSPIGARARASTFEDGHETDAFLTRRRGVPPDMRSTGRPTTATTSVGTSGCPRVGVARRRRDASAAACRVTVDKDGAPSMTTTHSSRSRRGRSWTSAGERGVATASTSGRDETGAASAASTSGGGGGNGGGNNGGGDDGGW